MTPQRMRTFLDRTPFQPFTVVKGDGEEVDVMARDLALLHPGGRTLYVVAPKFRGARTKDQFEDHLIDVFLVTDIVSPARRRSAKRR